MPVFVIKAKDNLAVRTVRWYADEYAQDVPGAEPVLATDPVRAAAEEVVGRWGLPEGKLEGFNAAIGRLHAALAADREP